MNRFLSDIDWKEFHLVDILNKANNSKAYHSNNLISKKNVIPYITRTNLNNGLFDIVKYSNDLKINPANTISFGAENATYFLQPYEYITGNKMYYYQVKQLSSNVLKFITICLNKSLKGGGFGYGLGLTGTRSDKRKFMLPVNSKGEPAYEFMEEYIKEREEKLKNQYKNYISNNISQFKKVELNKEWKEFFVSEIFNTIQRGKRLIKEHQKKGTIPYISSTSLNNGIDNFISNENSVRKYKNCLSLANSGSVGTCFYEPFEFIASDHITHLSGKYSKYTYLFMASMLNRLSEKYNFNREINDTRIKKEKIFLPINSKCEPDYEFMENYMKYLEQKKILQYLEYIKRQ